MEEELPHLTVNTQYIKDLSFENPKAPQSFTSQKEPPKIDLGLDINVTSLPEEGCYEVALHVEAKATSEGTSLFILELVYAGIFTLINIPDDQIKSVLSVNCPATIFPFARQVIADITQKSGFQPLLIDPIDFGVLYYKKLMEENGEGFEENEEK